MTTCRSARPGGGGNPCLTGTYQAEGNRFQMAHAEPKPSRHSAWYRTTSGAGAGLCLEGRRLMAWEASISRAGVGLNPRLKKLRSAVAQAAVGWVEDGAGAGVEKALSRSISCRRRAA